MAPPIRRSPRLVALAMALLGAVAIAAGMIGPQTATSAPECFNRAATITSNQQFVPGTPEADVIFTRDAGNDVVADAGDDRVCTNGGKDFVRGDLGDDRIDLGPGNDKASGGDLNPNNPGSGNDTIKGGRGNDELNGHDGADVLNGGPGTDVCRGGPGADELINCEN